MFTKKFFYIILLVFVIALLGSCNFSRAAAEQEAPLEESYPEETKPDETKGVEAQKFEFNHSISKFANESAEPERSVTVFEKTYSMKYGRSWEHPLFPWVVINEYLTDTDNTFSFFDQTGEVMSMSIPYNPADIGEKIDEKAAEQTARWIMEEYVKDADAYRLKSLMYNDSGSYYIYYYRYLGDMLTSDFISITLEKDGTFSSFVYYAPICADIDPAKYAEKFKQDDLYLQKLADFTRAEHGDEFVSLDVEDKYLSRNTSGEVIVVYKIGIQLKSGEYCDRGDPGIYYFVLDEV
ncbi:MAG: hypothetical protein FWE80_05635 [Oscillospiraceae bacterium]|nr:hypothetical protein [Oscillospiraceae bacterium]